MIHNGCKSETIVEYYASNLQQLLTHVPEHIPLQL